MTLGRWAAKSDPGRRRRRNEDSYVARPPLFAVADGMGGAQAGEVASRLAAAVLNESDGGDAGEERVAGLVQEANRRVFQRSIEDAATQGMGTTMTVALVDAAGGTIAFGHVGDSRAYRLRGGRLEQLTEDHSLVQELMRSGRLSPEEADTHPQKSVITRAVGTEPDVDVDTFTVDGEPGDLYLICSDGLTDMVGEQEIERALAEHRDDLERALDALVQAANRGGGIDNITVIAFELAGDRLGDTATIAPPAPPATADDEDTLDELAGVPVVDTVVLALPEVDAATEREPEPAERGSRKHGAGRGGRWLALVALVLALAAIAALVAWGLLR
jgi:PPM family protein phosphatase